MDIATKGKEYLNHFYPSDTMTADNEGHNAPNLMEYMLKGQLWAEIVVPDGSAATKGFVINAKVIGTQTVDSETIYINSPICFLSMCDSMFPKKLVANEETYTGVYTSGYDAYGAKINGMDGSAVS